MKKYSIALIIGCVCTMLLTGCSQEEKSEKVEETQNVVEQVESIPQVTQDYPQEDEPLYTINLAELTADQILELKQRFLVIDTFLPLDENLDEETLAKIAEFKAENGDDLGQHEIKSTTYDAFLELTDVKFADTSKGYLLLTNKNLSLRYDFEPENLVKLEVLANRETYLEEKTAKAVTDMFNAAKADGIELIVASGYRDFFYQEGLFSRKVANVGFENAGKVVAQPGESEHQTGLVLDITSASAHWSLEESFENTAEFAWLAENAADFGFILRYGKDQVDITGYSYEPWHYRYVGDPEIARFITENHLTLEEYCEEYM